MKIFSELGLDPEMILIAWVSVEGQRQKRNNSESMAEFPRPRPVFIVMVSCTVAPPCLGSAYDREFAVMLTYTITCL